MEQDINVTSVTGEKYWQEQVTAWKARGLKQMQYCREHQFSKHAFVYWKLKLLGKDTTPAMLVPVSAHQLRRMRHENGSAHMQLATFWLLTPGGSQKIRIKQATI